MKKALFVFLITVIGLAALFFLTRPGPVPVESQAVIDARNTAALAELQAKAQSARFWPDFLQGIAIVSFGLLVAVLAFVAWLIMTERAHARRMEMARISYQYDVVSADARGNYPLVRINGEMLQFDAGNSALPPQFVHGLMPAQLPTGRARATRETVIRRNRELTAYYTSYPADAQAVEAEQLTAAGNREIEIEANFPISNVSEDEFSDILPQLRDMIRKGSGKTAALKALGLVGRKYARASKLFDELKVEVDNLTP